MLLSAISLYIKRPIKKITKITLIFLFLGNLTFSMTNSIHQLILEVPLNDSVSFETFQTASHGPAFFIHIGISYITILSIFILIVRHFYKRYKKTQDFVPFAFVTITIISGLVLNLIHVFVYTFHIDPTFISMVLFVTIMYYIFYLRDIQLFMAFGRNEFIINNLSEKYLISNDVGDIIEVSNDFNKQFNLKIGDYNTYSDLKILLENKAVFYHNSKDIQYQRELSKIYLQVKTQEIELPLLKKTGTLYSFVDNTADIKYINDINYIKRHDTMTTLYNRNYLEEIRDSLDERKENYHIIMFDLDGLKLFNDYLGHEAGDDLIIRFSNQLKSVTDENDISAIRLGGDEFVILAVNKSDEQIKNIIKALENINRNLQILEKIHYSYAISSSKSAQVRLNQVLSEADKNMYKMKKSKNDYKEKLKNILEKEKERVSHK